MKLLHLADLHLGRRLGEMSLEEDQRAMLDALAHLARAEAVDAVLLAGDIYDKPAPAGWAVELLDGFLVELSSHGVPVYLISGNHDSPERLSFGSRLLAHEGVHIAAQFSGAPEHFVLRDAHGEAHLWLLPFVRPAAVRAFWPDEGVETYTDAVRTALAHAPIDPAQRNVLVAHQYVTGIAAPELCESESLSLGGLDNVDAACLSGFDYVALGHLHGPQQVLHPYIRYAGSPLKYSVSEAQHHKAPLLVTLEEKGNVRFEALPFAPLRDVRRVRGTLEALRAHAVDPQDYMHVVLTDEEPIEDAIGKVRAFYPNTVRLELDNARTRAQAQRASLPAARALCRDPAALFNRFYEAMQGAEMSGEERGILQEILREVKEEEP